VNFECESQITQKHPGSRVEKSHTELGDPAQTQAAHRPSPIHPTKKLIQIENLFVPQQNQKL
jgi:hypothetical protein